MKPSLLLALLFPTLLGAQTRYYVHPLATGAGTGLSWADAFTDLHDALAVAQKGDEIWVARGTYYPSLTGNRSARFVLLSGVRLYGGFRGTELDLSERDWQAHPTVIDGDIGVPGDSTDNTRTLLYLPWPDSNTVVDGLVFRNGMADDTLAAPRSLGNCGGAIFIQGINGAAYANFRNCVFQRNTAIYCGGAVYIHGAGTGSVAPTFDNCRFEDNRAVIGPGGAICRFGSSQVDRIDVKNCLFHKNTAATHGSAVYFWDTPGKDTIDIIRSDFNENQFVNTGKATPLSPGSFLGGICHVISFRSGNSKTFLNINDVNVKKNIGPVYYFNLLFSADAVIWEYQESSMNISKVHSSENAGDVHLAAVVTLGLSKYTIDSVTSQSENFRGIIVEGYLDEKNSETSVLKNIKVRKATNMLIEFYTKNLIVENAEFSSSDNKILQFINRDKVSESFIHVRNALFRRLAISFQRSGDMNYSSTNCTIEGRILSSYLLKKINLTNNIFFKSGIDTTGLSSTVIDLSHNLFTTPDPFPNAPPTWVKQNNLFETDPMFVQPDSGDFRLRPCSPAINAGTNSGVTWSTDILGNPRLQYGTVDIGAVEMGPLAFEGGGPAVRPACPGASTGRIDASALPVCPPAVFAWSTGSSSPAAENLPAGAYTLSVVDAKGRDGVFTITVPVATPPVLTPQSLPVQCGDTLGGSATVVVSGAPGPYAFQWAGSGSADSLQTRLAPGLYRVTVTDANGCTAEGLVKVERQGALSIRIDVAPIRCPGSADGYLTVLPANGKPPFTWAWSQPAGASGPTVGPLGPGLYIGTLTDAFGCQIGWSLPLTEPVPLSAQVFVTDATDSTAANGAIQLALSGGAGGYSVRWSNGGTGLHLLGLRPGAYVATIVDANGCELVTPVIVVGVKTSAWEAGALLAGGRVEPNPAASEAGTWLSLLQPVERSLEVRLWSAEGRLVRSWALPAGAQRLWLPLAGVPAGVYAVEVEGAALRLVVR